MESTCTRARSYALGGGFVWLNVALLSSGCVPELARSRLHASPAHSDAAASVDAAQNAGADDAGIVDAGAPPLPATEAGADAAFTEQPPADAEVASLDARPVEVETSVPDGSKTPGLDAGEARDAASSSVTHDGSVFDAARSSTQDEQRWVFDVAEPLSQLDSGVGVVSVSPAQGVVVDGSDTEWSNEGWLWISTPDESVGEPRSERDLSAALAVRWDSSKLYLVVVVMDQQQFNGASGSDIWSGDSIQVAFDMGQGRLPYDWEYGFAKTNSGLVAHRWRDGDVDLTSEMEFSVVRYELVTVYEVAFQAQHLGVAAFPADTLRLSVAVNDNDGQTRNAAIELVQGIVGTKSAEQFASAHWLQ
jgi:hypothetical protein